MYFNIHNECDSSTHKTSRNFELTDHLGNVLATVLDRKTGVAIGIAPTAYHHWSAALTQVSDYYPGGMMMPGRNLEHDWSRVGYNGKQKDDEVYGKGNYVDYGSRGYDTRRLQWTSIDPKFGKYPNLSPYASVGGNPVIFTDYDGRDFGVKINHDTKTIVIVANVYTTSTATKGQADAAAAQWNAKTSTVDGYAVSFEIKVKEPSKSFFSDDALAKTRKNRNNAAWTDAGSDKIGNVYAGTDGHNSKYVMGEEYEGGVTENGKHISMNTHRENGDMGNYEDLVTHELGHTLGLDDKGDKYYGGNNGIMEYGGTDISPISDNDVKTILRFTKDALGGKTKSTDAKVNVVEQIGKSDGKNPIGIKNEK